MTRSAATTGPARHPRRHPAESGKCPKCGGQVFEGPEYCVCEKSPAETKRCTFRVGRVILQQPVDHVQLGKLLSAHRTDLLTKFIAKAGRPFPANLVINEKGKVEFDFPPR